MSQEDLEMGSTTTETVMLSPSDSNTSSLSSDSQQQLHSTPTHEEQIKFVSVWQEQPKAKPETKVQPARSSPASIPLLIISSFCCIVFGMVAFYYNRKAFKQYGKRDNKSGDRFARRAKICAGIAITVGIVILLVLIAAAVLLWQFQAELPLEWFHDNQ